MSYELPVYLFIPGPCLQGRGLGVARLLQAVQADGD